MTKYFFSMQRTAQTITKRAVALAQLPMAEGTQVSVVAVAAEIRTPPHRTCRLYRMMTAMTGLSLVRALCLVAVYREVTQLQLV